MGYYVTLEVLFLEQIAWDEIRVKGALSAYTCNWLFLRDFPDPVLILSVYSTSSVNTVLHTLKSLYGELQYRRYTLQEGFLPLTDTP